MGRRTSNPENVKKEENIKEVVPKTTETKKKTSDAKAELRKKAREKKRLFTDDLEIAMFCNVSNSEFIYQDERENVFLEMLFGDTEVLTFKQLKSMRNTQRAILTSYMLIPYDVYSDELTLEDVVKELGIDRYYDEDMLYAESIDELLLDVNYSYFVNYIKGIKGSKYFNRVLDRALELTEKGEFKDSNKQLYLREVIGNLNEDDYDIFKNAFIRGQEK